MKTALMILTLVIAVTATAKEQKKKGQHSIESTADQQAVNDKPYREPVPGGARADHEFFKKWQNMIQPAKFKIMPHSNELKKDKDQVHSDERPRYIFHMATSKVDMTNEIWDEGYYVYAYSTKEQGDFLIQVHPKYRKCFDNLTKKFDEMPT